ncbi:hypothetical protein LOZ80_23415 [Paenibacillus sp. HWE-109]|uniref:hypothetical protein n=1 Tax=Paenibacillus sp. HWE-109 TaxID=1306526 RepID=UPI001EDD9942|nr:hypothetical protein [Paenibacillus sp. HWE-109]UKS24561.1 hypothetical protein LOZ80_23415 [Paenibacillus sp. HWE-109]
MNPSVLKCFACGYGTEIELDQPFIHVQVEPNDSHARFTTKENSRKITVELYGCPKCGTIQMKKKTAII